MSIHSDKFQAYERIKARNAWSGPIIFNKTDGCMQINPTTCHGLCVDQGPWTLVSTYYAARRRASSRLFQPRFVGRRLFTTSYQKHISWRGAKTELNFQCKRKQAMHHCVACHFSDIHTL